MRLRLNLSLRRALMATMATASTLLTSTAWGGTMHSDVPMVTYMDFAQNTGRFVVGSNVNALLSHIRTEVDEGIVIHYTDGTPSYTISNTQGMINFMPVHDGGYAAAIAPNMIATVAHNGEINGSFGERVLGADYAINYSAVGVRYSYQAKEGEVVFRLVPITGNGDMYDYCLQRQTKVITDVTWNPISSRTDVESLVGDYKYHAGGGSMNMWSETEGKYHLNGGYIIGSIRGIESATKFSDVYTNFSLTASPNYGDGVGATLDDPLPLGTEGGDSGSPVFIYNAATGQYEYIAAHQSGGGSSGWAQARGNVEWTYEQLERFNVRPDMSSGEVHLQAITSAGEYYADQAGNSSTTHYGYVTDAAGNILTQYNGVRSGLNTWADLSGIRNRQNWYAWDSDAYIQQSDVDLFFTENLVFTATQAENKVVLDATVDLGIGYAEFDAGTLEKASFTISSAAGENNMFNHAGYVINEGAEVHLQLTNPEDYMTEWRKIGDGDLYIDGTGNTNALLAVGGSGKTYLQQKDGWAAYNVIVSNGATVVIGDISQIERDLTFGNGGGVLDMNGNHMDWYANNPDFTAPGFSINALTEGATITNSTGTATLTFREKGENTWLGSFADTEKGALKIEYAGGGTWTMHSIHTDLSHHADSGLSVQNGKVVFSGIHTVHGNGSLSGNGGDRLELENDWHYADAKMNVSVADGATFELGSHARLTGDVTVAEGGTFIMREGVHDRYEYVEGGVRLEDTYQYKDFYGLKGNVSLSGNMLVEYSAGTTANTTYSKSLSGSGSLTVAAGTTGGTLTLSGDNSSFTGQKSITSGGVIAETLSSLGSAEQKWLIGKQGWLASHAFTDSVDILSYIATTSTGTLALSNDLTKQLDFSSHSGLFLGAEVGKTVQYGEAGTTDVWTATGDNYLLGGGGGTLVVNYQLTGDSKGVVLGADASSAGKVVLANAANDFGGTILFVGSGIILETAEGGMGNASLQLSYGNSLLSATPNADIERLSTGSDGIILVDKTPDTDIELTQAGLAVGASVNTVYTGQLTPAQGSSYNFSTVNGATLTLATQLNDAYDTVVDAQGLSGGTVVLAGNESYAGHITVQGHRSDTTAGDITLAFGRDMELSGDVTLKHGGTLDVVGHNATLSGNVTGSGGGIVNSTWEDPLDTDWSGTLTFSVADGETHTSTASIHAPAIYKTGAGNLSLEAANTFMNLYVQGGTLTIGHADAVGMYGTIHLYDGTTLDLGTNNLTKNSYLSSEGVNLHSGSASIRQTGTDTTHTSLIAGDVLLGSGAELSLDGAGIFAIGGTRIGGDNAVLRVNATQLNLQSTETVDIAGTLSFAQSGTMHSQAGSAGMTRNINRLEILNGANLTLTEQGGTNYWLVNELSGNGTLQWNSTTNHVDGGNSTASRLVLRREGDFEGSIVLNRTASNANHTHGAYIELAHDKAAQHADISLSGANANGWASLAINTADATIKGLSGNAHSYVFAGAAANTLYTGGAHPAATRQSTLTIDTAADKTYSYAGVVGSNADSLSAGLSLVKLGTGTQQFTGTTYLGHVAVKGGTLSFSGNTTVYGDITLTQGAMLSGIDFNLAAGKTFAVVAGASGSSADFGGTLTLGAGTLSFEGLGVASAAADGGVALNLGGVSFDGAQSSYTIQFANTGGLEAGTTYTLATGDWSSAYSKLQVTGLSAYDTAFGVNESGHLQLTLALKSGAHRWDGTDTAHSWSATMFGSTANALGAEAIALFDDSAANTAVSVAENVSVNTISFSNASKEYTVASGGGTATTERLELTGSGKVTVQSGVDVTGSTHVAGGELEVTSADVALGTVSGEGTLTINWKGSNTYTLDGLKLLDIKSGVFGAASDALQNVRTIAVHAGGTYTQGSGATYAGHIIADGGTIALSGGGLSGQMTVQADSYLNVAQDKTTTLDINLVQEKDAALIQTGRGKVSIKERGKTVLDRYIVREGTLSFAGYGTHSGQGSISVESGAMLQVGWGASLIAEQIKLAGGATLRIENGAEAWYLGNEVRAAILTEDGAIISGSANNTASVINGTISGSGILHLANTADSQAYTINSTISDADSPLSISVEKSKVTLTAANTYTGGTSIDSASTVTTRHASALGSGAVQNGGTLNMGTQLQLGGLSSADLPGAESAVVNTNGHHITIANNVDCTYVGTISGGASLTKLGSGTQTFSGSASLADVAVQGGTLAFSGAVEMQSATVSAGTLSLSGESAILSGVTVGAEGTLSLAGSVALGALIDNAGMVDIAGGVVFKLDTSNFVNGSFTLVSGSGDITYANELTAANFALVGYDMDVLAEKGISAIISQSGSTLSLSFTNFYRDLLWTGETDAQLGNANWKFGESTAVSFGVMDNITFDDSSDVRDVTVDEGLDIGNMHVNAGDYTFSGAGLNVLSSFHVAEDASATLNTMPTTLGSAAVDGTLNLAFTGTWTQELNAANGVVNKTASGTLNWYAEDELKIGTLNVNAGLLYVFADLKADNINIANSSNLFLCNDTAADALQKTIGRVNLSDSAALYVQNRESASNFTTLHEVVVEGSVRVGDYMYAGLVDIHTLSLAEGASNGTLTLYNSANQGSDVSVFNLGSESVECGNFAGKIVLRAGNGTSRGTLILSHADIAANSVVEISSYLLPGNGATYAQLGLGVHVDRATIAGLSSMEELGTKAKVFSGSYQKSANYAPGDALNSVNFTDVAERTLVINTAAESSYTFYGEVLSTVNIEKQGAGTQVLAGTVGSTKLSVMGGTLSLAGATIGSGALAQVDLARGATLQHNMTVDAAHTLMLTGNGSGATATLAGHLILGGSGLTFDGPWTSDTAASLTVAEGYQISMAEGVSTQTIMLRNDSAFRQGDSYFLLAGSFAEGITADSFTLAGLNDAISGTLTLENGGLWLHINNSSSPHIWAGTDDAHTWSGTEYGTTSSGVLTAAVPAIFDDRAVNNNVLVEGSVSAPGGIVFDNTEDYNISSSNIYSRISTTSFALTNTGTVTLGVALDAQSMSLSQGTLVLRDGATLTDGVQVSMDNGATLDMTSTTQSFSGLNMAEGTTITDFYGSATLTIKDPVALNGTINVGTIKTQGEVSLTVGDNTHTLHVQSGSTTLRGELVPANLVLDANTTLAAEHALALGSGSTIHALGSGATVAADITFGAGSTLLFDNAVLSESDAALNFTGDLSLGENAKVNVALGDVTSLLDGGTWELATGDWSAFSATDFVFDYMAPEMATFSISGKTLSMTLVAHRIWAGTDEAHSWDTAVFGSASALPTNAMAIFDDSAANKDVRLAESVSLVALRFDHSKDYTVTSENGATITTSAGLNKLGNGALRIQSDITLGGDVALKGGDVTIEGKTHVAGTTTQTSGTVTFAGAESHFGNYTISGGTLNVQGGSLSMKHLTAHSSSVQLAVEQGILDSLHMHSGANITFTKPDDADAVQYTVNGAIQMAHAWHAAGDLKVAEGVKLTANSISVNWGFRSIIADGDVEVKDTMSFGPSTYSSNLLTGLGSFTAHKIHFGVWSGVIASSDVAELNVTGELNMGNSGHLNLNGGVVNLSGNTIQKQTNTEFTINGSTVNISGEADFAAGAFNLQGGQLNITGGTTHISNTVNATGGELAVSGGTLNLTAATAKSLLQGVDALTLSAGTLDLSSVSFAADGAGIALKAAVQAAEGFTLCLRGLEAGNTYAIFDLSAQGASFKNWQNLNLMLDGAAATRFSGLSLALTETAASVVLSSDYNFITYDKLYWSGGASGVWDYTTSNWDGDALTADTTDNTTYAAVDTAYFAANTTTSITSALTLAPTVKIALEEGASVSLNADSFTFGSMSLAQNANLVLNGNLYTFTETIGSSNQQGTIDYYGTELHVSNGNGLNLYGKFNVHGDVLVSGNRIAVASGAELHLTDQSSLTRKTGVAYWMQGALVVDAEAEASFISNDDVHLSYQVNGGKIQLEEGSFLTMSVQNLTTYNDAQINVGANATLDLRQTKAVNLQATAAVNLADGAKLLGTLKASGNGVAVKAAGLASLDTLAISGGTTTVSLAPNAASASLSLGSLAMTGGTLTVAGGALSIDSAASTTGGTLRITGGALELNADSAVDLLQSVGNFSMSAGSLDLADVDFATASPIALKSGASFSFSGGTVELGDLQAGTTYHIFDASAGTLSGWNTLGAANFSLSGTSLADLGHVKLSLGADGTFLYNLVAELTWVGGASGNWSSNSWDEVPDADAANNVAFTDGYAALFNSTAAVTVDAPVHASSVMVTNNAHLTLTETAALSADSIQVDAGSTLTFATQKSGYSAANISGDGLVELNLTNADNRVQLGANFTGETYVTAGKLTTENIQVGTTLRLADGVTLVTKGGNMAYNLVLEGTTNVTYAASMNTLFMGTVTGDGTLVHSSNGYYEFHGAVNLAGFSNTSNVWGRDWFKDTATINSVHLDIGHLYFEKNSTITTLNVSSNANNYMEFGANGTHNITTATIAGGTVNFNGATNITTLSATGGTLNVGANLTVTGKTTASTLNVTAGQTTLKGDVDITTLTQTGGMVTLWNTTATAGASKLVDTVVLGDADGGAALYAFYQANGANVVNLNTLKVNGVGELGVFKSESCFNGVINIANLQNHVANTAATLTLSSGSKTNNTSVINVNGGDFLGTINVKANVDAGGNRHFAVNLNSSDVAADAVINFVDANQAQTVNFMALGLGATEVQVAGLSGTPTNAAEIRAYAVGKGADFSVKANANDSAARTLVLNVTSATPLSTNAKILDNISLVKNGSGSQTFTGVAAVGDVTVNNGTLALSHANSVISGDITVNGGKLDFDGTYTLGAGQNLHVAMAEAGAVDVAGLALAGGSLVFDTGVLGADSAALNVGALSLTAEASCIIDLRGAAALTSSSTGLMLASGDWSAAQGATFTIDGLEYGSTAVVRATASGLFLDYTMDSTLYTWTGDSNTTWDATTGNWENNVDESLTFASNGIAVFDEGSSKVTVSGEVQADKVYVINGANITLEQASGASFAANEVVVEDGMLVLGSQQNWKDISAFTVKEDGHLRLLIGVGIDNGTDDPTDILLQGGKMEIRNGAGTHNKLHLDLVVDGSGTIMGSRNGNSTLMTGTISGDGTLAFTKDADGYSNVVTINSTISDGAEGALGLHVVDTNVKLTGTNTYTGGTVIDADGTLTITNAQAMGGSGGKLGLLSGEGTLVINLAAASDVAVAYDSTLSGFTGLVEVQQGALYVGNLSTENTGRDAEFNAERVLVHSGAQLITHMNGNDNTFSSDVDLMSGATFGNRDGHIAYNGDIRFNVQDATAGTFDSNGTVHLYEYWSKTLTFNGVISGQGTVEMASSINENGGATYVLTNGDNTFSGTYKLMDGSNSSRPVTLVLKHQNAAKDATISMQGSTATAKLQLDTSATIAALNSTNANNVVTTTGAYTLTVSSGSFAGKLQNGSETNTLALTKQGNGTLTLSGANTYTGATTVSGGTLELTGAVSMAAQSNISLASGTTLLLNATNTTAMALGNAISGTGTTTIHKKGAYETVLSGNVNVTTINVKDGDNQATNAGTLTLSGDTVKADKLYAAYGTVNVGDGTDATSMQVTRMELGDSSATAGSASLNVKAAATLTVTGSNNGGDYKSASILLGEWNHGTNLNVAGKLLAPNAKALVGDNVANITIANGGVMAVKGMGVASVKNDKTQKINVNLQDGGTLILGDGGISTSKTFTGTLGAGTVGMSAASTTIAEDVTLNSAEGTTFDTTQYAFETNAESVATNIVRGTEAGEMTISGNISSAEGVAAKMKVAGNGELTLNGNATLGGGLEVEQGAKMYVSSTASIESTADNAAATMEGALSIKQATDSEASSIKGTGDTATTMNNSLITIAQGASLTVDNMIISESSRITGQTAATFAARTAGVTNLTATNTTVMLGEGNAEVAGQAATLAQNTLVSLDGTATTVQMAGDYTTLAVTSNALSSLTLNAGSSLTIDFSSLLADVQIANIDLIELSFADVSFDPADNITISGVLGDNRMMAYYLAPAETAVANVGSIYFATDSIPEPTTTTLSILALAALAARRRRR